MRFFAKIFFFFILLNSALFAQRRFPVMKELPPLPPDAVIVEGLPPTFRPTVLPESFDWRNNRGHDWTTSTKNQGLCGSCWAFAAVAQLESAVKIFSDRYALPIDLAEQELVSCDTNYNGCLGGNFSQTYLANIGIVDESCFPYITTQDTSWWLPCDDICANPLRKYRLGSQLIETNFNIAMLKQIVYNTPCFVAVSIWSSFYELFHMPENYIWSPQPGDYIEGYHAMLCIGWNDRDRYFIFKNSWTSDFGHNGYVKISYDCMQSNATKQVWYQSVVPMTTDAFALLIENYISGGGTVRSDTSYHSISSDIVIISRNRKFLAGGKWYEIEDWALTKDTITGLETMTGLGCSISVALDAPMTITWNCSETEAPTEGCLSNENLMVFPNPFVIGTDPMYITFELCKNGSVDVKIFDVGYNLVRTVIDERYLTVGDWTFEWDGTTDEGRRVVPGVYYIFVESTAGEHGVGKLIVRAK